MADIIAFPQKPIAVPARYDEVSSIGSASGITVRILARNVRPWDLLVVLSGTRDGGTTVAALPSGEMGIAEAIAHSTLAALEAAETTWDVRQTGS